MDNLWQNPYVNVFKHFNVPSWKKATKEGDVVSLMDKTVKSTVYRITGSIPAGNFIQLPKTNTQSLGLTGRYVYLLFKPLPCKHFVVHLDVATADNLVIRISFSNLFKQFKATSTWLQFPFLCNSSHSTLPAFAVDSVKDQSGPAPLVTRWTLLCLDLQHVLSVYLNRQFLYLKSIRLCANMMVRNVFTSHMLYDPGLTTVDGRKQGQTLGVSPLPRDMCFPVGKGEHWHDVYDWIRFPSDGGLKIHDAIQVASPRSRGKPVKLDAYSGVPPKRIQPPTLDVSKCVSDRVSMIHKLTAPKQPPKHDSATKELPSLPLDMSANYCEDDIHVYSHPEHDLPPEVDKEWRAHTKKNGVVNGFISSGSSPPCKSLEPDPIMKLRRIIGFGGASYRDVLWAADGLSIIYPCHAVVVSMKVNNGQQRFFVGHTDKVSCLALTNNSSLLASGQTGQMSVVRVWKYSSGECLAVGKAHVHSLVCLSFSLKGTVLCAVGKDGHNKNMVVIWNTSRAVKHREITVIAKAHTDLDIARIIIAPFDDTKMVSCGRENVRLWKIKEGALRSAPFNLGEYQDAEFTDICFESSHLESEPDDKLVYSCTKSGHIFELDYGTMGIRQVRRLLPLKNRPRRDSKIKAAPESSSYMAINSMHMNETFCVTGSDDGFLRLWPLDFAHVYLEAEHEGPVATCRLSYDGLKILAATSCGSLGILDVSLRQYTTVMRAHTGRIHCLAIDPRRKHLATVSDDHTIRVWDIETLQQLYDFSAPEECPCSITYHPAKQIFACGFHNGTVKVFNVESTCLIAELRHLRGQVTGVVYSPEGTRLYSCCSLGVIALYDSSTDDYKMLRVMAGLVARGEHFGPEALTLSPCGRRIAYVGPTELIVTVADARYLDELVRISVSDLTVNATSLDAAQRVTFSPAKSDHLLVTTASNRLLRYDAKDGQLLRETDHIHRTGCSAICVSRNGRYLATGGDKTIKIWDYNLHLDINFQVFIGHSENVCRILFTPDGQSLISAGEAVYMWEFLGQGSGHSSMERQMILHDSESSTELVHSDQEVSEAKPRPKCFPRGKSAVPAKSVSPTSEIDGLSSIHGSLDEDEIKVSSRKREPGPDDNKSHNKAVSNSWFQLHTNISHVRGTADPVQQSQPVTSDRTKGHPTLLPEGAQSTHEQLQHMSVGRNKKLGSRVKPAGSDNSSPPSVFVHYKQRDKATGIAQRRYTAPQNQAGLKLHSVIGFNCNGRNNMVWHPDTGLFAYTTGCVIVIEDLSSGKQKHLQCHTEEVSCLAVQHDSQCLASASPSFRETPCQICVWDLQRLSCTKVLLKHKFAVQCLAYSRDDRFLISVGDYRECTIAVWDSVKYQLVATSITAAPIHSLKWDPFTVNEFVSVGEDGSVLFWLLDETCAEVCLNVHEAGLPPELWSGPEPQENEITFTALAYAGDNIVYIGTSGGHITAWDTHHNSCFLHWAGDSGEITKLVSRHSRLMTAGTSHKLKLWSVGGVSCLRPRSGAPDQAGASGLTMEDEMSLDGVATCAEFDDTLDMGIVGTSGGTLWYINWTERTSIRLVSGHQNKINGIHLTPNNMILTGGDDGSVRVWSVANREQAIQFQVKEQSCSCLAVAPGNSQHNSHVPMVACGYSDGTIRIFDVNKAEMLLKMHPHAVTVTAIIFSADGVMVMSGGSDGLIAISSPTTGMTVRVIHDHKGVAISLMDVAFTKDLGVVATAPTMWLASSIDRRVSVWSADWTKDFCELIDWLTFPAPAFMPDGTLIAKNDSSHFYRLPPTLARFSPTDPHTVIYTGYGLEKIVQFYSLRQRKVVRNINLTHWSLCLDVSPDGALIALGIPEHLLKLMDFHEGSFQDFTGHSDGVSLVKFSPSGTRLMTVSHNELFLWEVML